MSVIVAELEGQLLAYLTDVSQKMDTFHGDRGSHLKYSSYEALVLSLGRPWASQALPLSMRRGERSQCFRNARKLVIHHRTLTYVEGYAMAMIEGWVGIPVQHAWVVDREGRVIDVTWPEPEASAYYGLAFERADVVSFFVKYGDGILPGEYQLYFPLLKHGRLYPDSTRPDFPAGGKISDAR